jgi:hypothetical protein
MTALALPVKALAVGNILCPGRELVENEGNG